MSIQDDPTKEKKDPSSERVEFSYKQQMDLWNFYTACPEVFKAIQMVCDGISVPFKFTWGEYVSEMPSYFETIEKRSSRVKSGRKRSNVKKMFEEVKEGEEGDDNKEVKAKNNDEDNYDISVEKRVSRLTKEDLYQGIMSREPRTDVSSDYGFSKSKYDYLKESGALVGTTQKEKEKQAKKLVWESEDKASDIDKDESKIKGKKDDQDKDVGEEDDIDEYIPVSVARKASDFFNFVTNSSQVPVGGPLVTSDEAPLDVSWMAEFMKRMIINKYVFGMSPYLAGEDENLRLRLYVPNISDGQFVGFLDKNSQIQVYWKFLSHRKRSSYKRACNVYVWADSEPNIHLPNNPFSSVVFRLMDDWYTLTSTKQNKLDGDYLSSHPPILTKCTEKLPDFSDYTTGEMFDVMMGNSKRPQLGTGNREREKIKMDKQLALRQSLAVSFMNDYKAKSYFVEGIQKQISSSTHETEKINRSTNWESLRQALSYGTDTAGFTLPRAPADYAALKTLFEKHVSNITGMQIGEPLGSISNKTAAAAEYQQSRSRDTIYRAKIDAKTCLEDCFTLALGKEEDNSIRRSLENLESELDEEYRALRHLETYYGKGEDNPLFQNVREKAEMLQMINNAVYGKAFEVVQFAMKDGISLSTDVVRQYIKDRLTFHMFNIGKIHDRKARLISALKSSVRLQIIWKIDYDKESMIRLTEGFKQGLISEEATRIIFLNAMKLPPDTPKGILFEERLEKIKLNTMLEQERAKCEIALKIEKERGKNTMRMQQSKIQTQDATPASPQAKTGTKRKSKESARSSQSKKKKDQKIQIK